MNRPGTYLNQRVTFCFDYWNIVLFYVIATKTNQFKLPYFGSDAAASPYKVTTQWSRSVSRP